VKTKWVITIETKDREHNHIDVADPDAAAIVINEINDARETQGKGPAKVRLESYDTEWVCTSCGERKFNTEADTAFDTGAQSE
jgi:hypothetical protein